MSRELQDVDLAEVKPLVEKGETITGLLQEFDVQEQDIETLHGSIHVPQPLPHQRGHPQPLPHQRGHPQPLPHQRGRPPGHHPQLRLHWEQRRAQVHGGVLLGGLRAPPPPGLWDHRSCPLLPPSPAPARHTARNSVLTPS
uniref:N-myc downstream regulated 1 n=1 Tax=Myotis myotis TaxID=51298 RepID=A0A7J7TK26_MYOMY|nr:N-myc downstream regulated 1 [Myotis myotis]